MLENHADILSGSSQLAITHSSYFLAVNHYSTLGWSFQKIDAAYQSGFSGAAKSDNTVDITLLYVKAYILEGSNRT